MRKAILYGLLLTSLAFVSCNQKGASKMETPKGTGPTPVKIKIKDLASDKDLNCGMTLVEGAINDTTSYQGKIYGFCSPDCKAEFLKDPQSHINK